MVHRSSEEFRPEREPYRQRRHYLPNAEFCHPSASLSRIEDPGRESIPTSGLSTKNLDLVATTSVPRVKLAHFLRPRTLGAHQIEHPAGLAVAFDGEEN